MSTESTVRTDDDEAEIAALRKVLEIVRGIANTDDVAPVPGQRSALAAKVTQILSLITDGDFAPFLTDRLLNLTQQSHTDLIATVNPSLRLLNRRAEGARDEIALALNHTEGEIGYGLGDFVIAQNPYKVAEDFQLRPNGPDDLGKPGSGKPGSLKEARLRGRGGAFANFSAETPWLAENHPGQHIPHPNEAPFKTWYWVTGYQPKDVYAAWKNTDQTEWNAIKSKARNIVKSVEIEYTPDVDAGDKVKPPHLILLYAGGNST